MIALDLLARPVVAADHNTIANLIHFEQYTHRHLDWRGPLEWVGSPYFWLAQQNGRSVAALACPPDPDLVYWIRLFASASSVPVSASWHMLWETARAALAGQTGQVAVIALHDWMAGLVESSGFVLDDDIVMLTWSGAAGQNGHLSPGLRLRPMEVRDLPEVADADAAAFSPLWRNSLASLRLAFPQAGLAMVAELDSQVVGYQISTYGPFGAHLARLAVLPTAQRRGVGQALLNDLVEKVRARGMQRITVNTQSRNLASQSLYKKAGFMPTGESYPVYYYPLERAPNLSE